MNSARFLAPVLAAGLLFAGPLQPPAQADPAGAGPEPAGTPVLLPSPSARAEAAPGRATGTDWQVLMVRSALGGSGPSVRLPRLAVAGIDLRFLTPSERAGEVGLLVEVPFDFEHLRNLASIDFGGVVTRELAYFRQVADQAVLHVILTGDPPGTGAHQASDPARELRLPAQVETVTVRGLDSSTYPLRRPVPCLFFPRGLATVPPEQLTRTFKHELAHALHLVRNPIRHGGYWETFGGHSPEQRTSDRTAYVEGFAEYVEARFAQVPSEFGAATYAVVWNRKNPDAYGNLLVQWWDRFLRDSRLEEWLEKSELEAAWRQVRGDPSVATLPTLEEFFDCVATALSGRGRPPIEAIRVREGIARFCRENPEAMRNLADEGRALGDPMSAVPRPAAPVRWSRAAARRDAWPPLAELPPRAEARPPLDLLVTEGAVAMIFLAADRELALKGLDFLALALRCSHADVYGGRGSPPWPVNAKELLAVMDRQPELRGSLVPLVERVTRGLVRQADLTLCESRERDPLVRHQPGRAPDRPR